MRRTETAGAIPESLRRQESSEDKYGSLCGQAGQAGMGPRRVGWRQGLGWAIGMEKVLVLAGSGQISLSTPSGSWSRP